MQPEALAGLRRAWPTLLVYVSLGFVVIWLAQSGNLVIPVINAPGMLVMSVACLLTGFLASAAAWRRLLVVNGYPVGLSIALASVGLTIFGKYVPGKLWVILGRAGYTANLTGYPLGALSAVSVTAQLLAIWLGLLFGMFVFVAAPELGYREIGLLVITVGVWVLLTAILVSDSFGRATNWLRRRLSFRLPELPRLHWRLLVAAMPPFMLSWIAWMLGFSLFVSGLTGHPPVLAHGAAFALAATLGILAVAVPGGLGVREGLLVLLMTPFGVPAAVGTGIAVNGRIWFLLGEVGLFILGLLAKRRSATLSGGASLR